MGFEINIFIQKIFDQIELDFIRQASQYKIKTYI